MKDNMIEFDKLYCNFVFTRSNECYVISKNKRDTCTLRMCYTNDFKLPVCMFLKRQVDIGLNSQ